MQSKVRVKCDCVSSDCVSSVIVEWSDTGASYEEFSLRCVSNVCTYACARVGVCVRVYICVCACVCTLRCVCMCRFVCVCVGVRMRIR